MWIDLLFVAEPASIVSITWRYVLKTHSLVGEKSFLRLPQNRGRRAEIEDWTLGRRLQDFQFVLEQNWGMVGWALHEAHSEADLRLAFSRITEYNCAALDDFRHEPVEESSLDEIKGTREALRSARSRSASAYEVLAQTREIFESIRGSIQANDLQSVAKLRQIQQAGDAISIEDATLKFESSRVAVTELSEKLENQEAFYAQSQLLAFIRSGRRSFTPWSIASAMAGLPFISARVSCERCSKLDKPSPSTPSFNFFLVLQRVFSFPPPKLTDGIEQLKAIALGGSKKKPEPHIADLRKNWYFIEAAICTAYASHPLKKGELPYRILADYVRRYTCQSVADVYSARQVALSDENGVLSEQKRRG